MSQVHFANGNLCIPANYIRSNSKLLLDLGKLFIGKEMTEEEFLKGVGIQPMNPPLNSTVYDPLNNLRFKIVKIENGIFCGENEFHGQKFNLNGYAMTTRGFRQL